jgi:hypothetical protein
MTPEAAQQLELLIDKFSLVEVADALADICFAKSDHAATHWQDKTTAHAWNNAGYRVNQLVAHQAIITVS